MTVQKLLDRYQVRPARRAPQDASIDHLCQVLARIIQRQTAR